MRPRYEDLVFINCPFDPAYQPLFEALVFTVHHSGFVARCALEVSDSSKNRLSSIMDLIAECGYGIHDISRTQLDPATELPRFNMPLEFGIFLGCKRYGGPHDQVKRCLVLDQDRYRYQKFISDIVNSFRGGGARLTTAARFLNT